MAQLEVLLVGSRMFHSISKLRNKDDEANHGSSSPVFQAPARNCDMVGGRAGKVHVSHESQVFSGWWFQPI